MREAQSVDRKTVRGEKGRSESARACVGAGGERRGLTELAQVPTLGQSRRRCQRGKAPGEEMRVQVASVSVSACERERARARA